MRILHWYPNYFDEGGGVAVATASLALSQAEQGATVAIATAEQETGADIMPLDVADRVEILRWRPTWRVQRGPFVLRGIHPEDRARLRAFQPDVVHVHSVFLPDNAWSVRLFDAPVLVSPRGGYHPVVFTKGNTASKRAYTWIMRWLYYRRAAAFHALDPDEARHIAAVVPGVRLFTVPQGPNRATITAPLPPPAPRPDATAPVGFIFVGRLHTYTKGLDILIDAFAHARQQTDRPMTLTLVGPSHQGSREALEAQARARGVHEAVHFTGPVSGDTVRRLLSEADVYVQLSRHEGFSLSVAEALAAGKPAVLTDRIGTVSYPAIAELPHIHVVPLGAEPAGEAIAALADDIDRMQAAGTSHFQTITDFFSWERVVRETEAMYRKLKET